jgi:hypothetical protein
VEELSAPRTGRRRTYLLVAGLLVAVLAIAAGVVVFWANREPAAVAAPSPKSTRPPTPFELAAETLNAQAAALVAGDEKGWLAAVDPGRPAVVARYRDVFRNLRGLDVSHAEFHAKPLGYGVVDDKPGTVTAQVRFGYCFSGVACPSWRDNSEDGPPKVTDRITFKLTDGRYLITDRTTPPGTNFSSLEPAPWDGAALSFARGDRVTVAATRSQAKYAHKVLAAAEKAAATADHFAAYVGNQQKRYRIYLADDRAWKTWYGGDMPNWVVGYEIPLNSIGADVVLRTEDVMKDKRELALVVQHELGHVVTLAGVTHWDTDDDQWLLEGVAEYIGAYPQAAGTTRSRGVLAAEFRRRDAPKTIATATLSDDADDRTVDRLYAMGHYAASCMADRYGERKLFDFVGRVLRQGEKPDEAARAAYGQSFAAVDKACLKWIKGKVT